MDTYTARAHANIALVKYWGKKDAPGNVPAAGSLSFTMGGLTTVTTVRRIDGPTDVVTLDGAPASGDRVARFLDLVRRRASRDDVLEVSSHNDFPTAAGLASSASGFAALTLAATRALGLDLDLEELSRLARIGSGSAARSLHGGWVEVAVSEDDAVAVPLAPPEHWALRCVVFLTAAGAKDVDSTSGMNLTRTTSPYYSAWIGGVADDLAEAREAVKARDFEQLAQVSERSCLRMHASAIAADPGILYWNGRTIDLMHRIRAARARGLGTFFTIDAGPHVKAFCAPDDLDAVRTLGEGLVDRVLVSAPGGAARVEVTS